MNTITTIKSNSLNNTYKPLLYYYKFNSGDIVSNLLANYKSGVVYDASVNNATISTSTYKGGLGSMFFNNSTVSSSAYDTSLQWVKCPSFTTPSTRIGLSISLWVNPSSISSVRDWTCALTIGKQQSDYITIGLLNSAVYIGMYGSDSYNGSLTAGAWTHVVWTISSDGVHVVYIDNVSYTPAGINGKLIKLNYTHEVAIGFNNSYPYYYWNGYVDDLRIYYNTVLTSNQVSSLYNNPT